LSNYSQNITFAPSAYVLHTSFDVSKTYAKGVYPVFTSEDYGSKHFVPSCFN